MATDEYVTFKLWELLFPSLTARKIVKPFLPLLAPIYNTFGAANPMETFGTKHMFDMQVADEEEFMLFHLMNSSYLTGFLSPTCFDQQLGMAPPFPTPTRAAPLPTGQPLTACQTAICSSTTVSPPTGPSSSSGGSRA